MTDPTLEPPAAARPAGWRHRSSWRRRPSPSVVAAAALVVVAVAYGAWLLLGLSGTPVTVTLNDIAFIPIGLTAVAVAGSALRTRNDPGHRRAWLAFALAFASFALADIYAFDAQVMRGRSLPTPSVADLGYLTFYPLMVVAFLLLPRDRQADPQRLALDLAIVVVGTGTAIWWLVLGPVAASVESDQIRSLVALAYPVGSTAMLFALAATASSQLQRTPAVVIALLVTGALLNLAADLTYARMTLEGSGTGGTLLSAAYTAAWAAMLAGALIGVGATARGARLVPATPARPIPGLPYLATGLVFGLLAASTLDDTIDEQILALGAIAVTVLASARQIVTARQNALLLRERERLASETRFRTIIQHASDVIAVVDARGRVTYATPSAASLLGTPVEALRGSPATALVAAEDAPLLTELLQVAAGRAGDAGPIVCRTPGGEPRVVEVSATDLLSDPLVAGHVVTIRDVSERQRYEEQLRSQALHDPLTGLANRTLFADRLEGALQRARRRRARPAVLYLDVDDFKSINDTLGHAAGDAALVELSRRIRGCIRAEDTAARLGGDEFAVLIEDCQSAQDALACVDRIQATLGEPFLVGGERRTVAVSIGVVRSDSMEDDPAELLRNADIAMYAAKQGSRGTYQVFEAAMYHATVDRVRLEADLRHALDRAELEVVYQPLLDLSVLDRPIAVEALVRWRHPARGLLLPGTFIPIAESSGLIRRLGLWVLEEAARTVGGWNARRPDAPLRANVNLSIRQIDETLPDGVAGVLARVGFPAELLTLEVTESIFAGEREGIVDVLDQLRALGARIAVDDFGTGYSALSYLRDLPVDELKLDRTFIEGMVELGERSLVSVILQLGRDLSLRTTAEGIEETAQLDLLRELGCEVGQGYLLGRPMSAAGVERLLRLAPPAVSPGP